MTDGPEEVCGEPEVLKHPPGESQSSWEGRGLSGPRGQDGGAAEDASMTGTLEPGWVRERSGPVTGLLSSHRPQAGHRADLYFVKRPGPQKEGGERPARGETVLSQGGHLFIESVSYVRAL